MLHQVGVSFDFCHTVGGFGVPFALHLVQQYIPTTTNGCVARNGTNRHATTLFDGTASDYSALVAWTPVLGEDIKTIAQH